VPIICRATLALRADAAPPLQGRLTARRRGDRCRRLAAR